MCSFLSGPYLSRGLLVVGLALCALLVWHIGPLQIGNTIWRVGWAFPLIVIPHSLVTLCEAGGWWYAFSSRRPPISYRRVFEFTVAAKAIQLVTPSFAQTGELVRIQLLRSAGVNTDMSAASVIAAKTTIMIAEFSFILTGLAMAPSVLVRDKSVFVSVGIGLLLMAASIAGIVMWQRLGLFTSAIWVSRRLKVLTAFLDRHEDVLVSTDDMLRRYLAEGRRLFLSCAVQFLGWLAGVLEAWLFLAMLGLTHADMLTALIVQVWLIIIVRLTGFVPGNLGTQEAGVVMIFSVLGLAPESAIAFALLRRARQVVWIAAGFGILTRIPLNAPAHHSVT